ncbi:MAG: tetratricopeptide repeat protein [Candidatus Sericytochromatia bacterium]|nr:tetratricopeptide repeat protein [Candidatus Sericytochromatia bacterium]
MHPDAQTHYQEGLAHRDRGYHQAACLAFERALKADPAADDARVALAATLHLAGDAAAAAEQYGLLAARRPEDAKLAYNHGVSLAAANRLGDAEQAFERALRVDPMLVPALESLLWVHHQTGQKQAALGVLHRLVVARPDQEDGWFQLARAYRESGDVDRALATIEGLVRRRPDLLPARLLRAEWLLERQPEEAWAELERVRAVDPEFLGVQGLVERLVEQGAARAALDGDLVGEARWLERLVPYRARDAVYLGRLVEAAAHSGDRKAEARWLEALAELRPDDAPLQQRLADLYVLMDLVPRALPYLERCAAARPDDAEAALALARARVRAAHRAEAIAGLEVFLGRQPRRKDVLFMLADLCVEEGRLDRAEALARQALGIREAALEAELMLVRVHQAAGRNEEAWQALQAVADHYPDAPEVRTEGAALCRRFALHPPADADADAVSLLWWERFLVFQPDDVQVLDLLAGLYGRRGATTEAQRVLERLVALAPGMKHWLDLGAVQQARGQAEAARHSLEQALAIEARPEDALHRAQAALQLAGVLLDLGFPHDALTILEAHEAAHADAALARTLTARAHQGLSDEAARKGDLLAVADHLERVVALTGDRVALRSLAAARARAGDRLGAEEAWQRVLVQQPDDREALAALGDLAATGGRTVEAERCYRQVLALEPDDVATLGALADLVWGVGRRQEAYQLYERLMELDADHVPAVLGFARDALVSGQPLEAWEYARRVLAQDPARREAHEIACSALRALATEQEPAGAIAWWQRLVVLEPEDASVRRGLWDAYARIGAQSEAVEAATAWLALDPTAGEAALFLAERFRRSGDLATARERLAAAVEGGDPRVAVALGLIDLELGAVPAGRDRLEALLREYPGDAAVRLALVRARILSGAGAEAWELLGEERDGDPAARALALDAAVAAAEATQASGDALGALEWWRKAQRLAPDDVALQRRLMQFHRAAGQLEDAAQAARTLLVAQPADVEAALYLGKYLASRGQHDEALQVLSPVAKEPSAAWLLASAAWQAGRPAEALTWLEGLGPALQGHPDALLLLARALRATGRPAEAWAALQRLEVLQPDDPETGTAMAELAREAAGASQPDADQAVWLHRLLVLRPTDRSARAAYADLLGRMDRPVDAARLYGELALMEPDSARWCILEAEALQVAGRHEDAARALAEARIRDPRAEGLRLAEARLGAAIQDYTAVRDAVLAIGREGRPGDEERRLLEHAAVKLAEGARLEGRDRDILQLWSQLASIGVPHAPLLRLALDAARRLGDDEVEAAILRDLWDVLPGERLIGLAAAQAFERLGDLRTALSLRERLETGPGDPVEAAENALTAARLAFAVGDLGAARPWLDRLDQRQDAISGRPEREAAWAALQLIRRLDRQDLAGPGVDEAVDEAWSRARDAGLAEGLLQRSFVDVLRWQAAHAEAAGDLRAARETWLKVGRMLPEDREAFAAAARLGLALGHADEALDMLRVLHEDRPEDPEAVVALGRALLAAGRSEEALALWEDHHAAYGTERVGCALAEQGLDRGDVAGAWLWTGRVLARHPRSLVAAELAWEAGRGRAEELAGAGRHEAAVRQWEEVATIVHARVDRLRIVCLGMLAAEGTDEAGRVLEQMRQIGGEDGAHRRLEMMWLARSGQVAKALALSEIVLAEAEGDPELEREALMAVAGVCLEAGRLDEGWVVAQRLLDTHGASPEARRVAGRMAREMAQAADREGDPASALVYRQVQLALAPQDREAVFELATLHGREGRIQEAEALLRPWLARHPRDDEGWLELAVLVAVEQPAESVDIIRGVIERQPAMARAHRALAALLERGGRVGEAMDAVLAAAEVADRPEEDWLSAAEMAVRQGQDALAWHHLDRVLTRRPGHARAMTLGSEVCRRLARAAAREGRHEAARESWQALLRIVSQDLEAYRALGSLARAESRFDEAEAALSRALSLDPEDLATLEERAWLDLDRGLVAAARERFAVLVSRGNAQSGALLGLAEAAWQDGEADTAWQHLEELLRRESRHPRGLELFAILARHFGKACMAHGDARSAHQWWQLVLRQQPRDAEALRSVGEARLMLGDLLGAADSLEKAVDLKPDDVDLCHRLADVYRQVGHPQRAEAALKRVVAASPGDLASLRALSRIARERAEPGDVVHWAQAILDVVPDDPEAMFDLAQAFEARFEKRASLETYRDLVARNPRHAEGWHELARLLHDLGQHEEARRAATNAVVHGAVSRYHVTLGRICAGQGQQDEAMAAWGQALVLDPDEPEALARLGFGLLRETRAEEARVHLVRAHALLEADSELALEVRCALDLMGEPAR